MFLLGPIVLLVCAVSFATLDVCRKKLALGYSSFRILTIVMGLQAPLYALWFFARPVVPDQLGQYAIWGGFDIIFNLAANVFIVLSLSLAPLSNAAPLLALTPTFSLIFQPLFHFPVGLTQICGAVIIFLGALVLNGLPKWGRNKRTDTERGLFFMFIAAFFCGILILFDKRSLNYATIPFHGLVQNSGMALISFSLEKFFRIRGLTTNIAPRISSKYWMGAILAAFLAGVCQLESLAYFQPGVVESVKRALILFLSVTFGFLLFKEPLTLRKILGVFCMAMGIVLISLL